MTKQKTTKRALLSSMLVMLICVAMLIGTTFAWFTDSVTSGSNVIKSGTLDIVLEYTTDGENWIDAEGEVIPFVAKDGRTEILWEPGCTYNMAAFRVRNVGNLTAYCVVTINGIDGDARLLEAIDFTTNVSGLDSANEKALIKNGFDDKLDGEASIPATAVTGTDYGTILWDECLMPKGKTSGNGLDDTSVKLTVSGHMKEEAGNEYQNLSVNGISITVLATQCQYEKDSFGSNYDADAELPEVTFAETKAELKDAISNAKDGDIITLKNDVTVDGYTADNKLVIDKAIVLNLNGKTLTTECGWGGIDLKGGASIKNGTINHTGNTAAIKAFQVGSIDNVTINVTQTSGKIKGGIVVQEGAGCYVGSIKNVTIIGATNGIETYRCGNRSDLAIGSMENVTIDATDTGILLSAPIGKVTNCNIKGANIGVNMYLYGPYSVSMELVNSTVTGATGIYAYDEIGETNPGSLTLKYDDKTVINGGITQEFEAEVTSRVTIN